MYYKVFLAFIFFLVKDIIIQSTLSWLVHIIKIRVQLEEPPNSREQKRTENSTK